LKELFEILAADVEDSGAFGIRGCGSRYLGSHFLGERAQEIPREGRGLREGVGGVGWNERG
jgi:hypothetical protein